MTDEPKLDDLPRRGNLPPGVRVPHATAHLIIEMRVDGAFPMFIGCRIFSQSATSMTFGWPNTLYAEVLSLNGKDYQDARDRMVDLINTHDGLKWARPYFKQGIQEYLDLLAVGQFLRRGMPGVRED